MQTKQLPLSALKENPANPRQISEQDFTNLISSLLGFRKMLELRPIILDKQGYILGGNMRYRALSAIATMEVAEIEQRLSKNSNYLRLSTKNKKALITEWVLWQDKPIVPTVKADDLTDEQIKEFIIKDNVQQGKWDYDMLANQYCSIPAKRRKKSLYSIRTDI